MRKDQKNLATIGRQLINYGVNIIRNIIKLSAIILVTILTGLSRLSLISAFIISIIIYLEYFSSVAIIATLVGIIYGCLLAFNYVKSLFHDETLLITIIESTWTTALVIGIMLNLEVSVTAGLAVIINPYFMVALIGASAILTLLKVEN